MRSSGLVFEYLRGGAEILSTLSSVKSTAKQKLLARINRKDWWHVPPTDPKAYQQRGKFLASTFAQAEFWGRPLDTPIHVNVKNPLIGDEPTIETELLGAPVPYPGDDHPKLLKWRWALDAKLKKAALAKGYDALLLLSTSAYDKFSAEGKIPVSLELNLLREDCELFPALNDS
jgi:hypothetical protein